MSGTRVTTSRVIGAGQEAVWGELSKIEDHVEWMADAVALDFHSEQRSGVGTSFACKTKIGPFSTTDEMVIDQWEEGVSVGVTHRGAVVGTGLFTLEPVDPNRTRITWSEMLTFPWWMGGPIGSALATPFFHWIWRRNLDRLALRVEAA
jgi:hypothetical protein